MIQIRKGTFETNSSSSHSLVIAPKAYTEVYGYMKNEIPDYMIDNGVILAGSFRPSSAARRMGSQVSV